MGSVIHGWRAGGSSQPCSCRSRRRSSDRSEEHTSELQSRLHLVCRLLLEKKKVKDLTAAHIDPRALGGRGCPLLVRSDRPLVVGRFPPAGGSASEYAERQDRAVLELPRPV